MCGRYRLKSSPGVVVQHFGLDDPREFPPREQIFLTNSVPAVRLDSESRKRKLDFLTWGLIPSWAKEPKKGFINARAETVAEKSSFSMAFRLRRCLLVADGFYEWKTEGKTKTQYLFQLEDGGRFAFAGLWERYEKAEPPIESCTLLTTEPNGLVSPVHDRMPVKLKPEDHDRWLNPFEPAESLKSLLVPFPHELMTGQVG
jgi:putative SOS response-associated peptidase YedK